MGKLIHLLGAIVLMPGMVEAQSAIPTAEAGAKPAPADKVVDKPATAEKPAASATPAKADASKPADVSSRYLGNEDVTEYIESVASLFAIRSRTTDPFCQVQDPSAVKEPPKKPVRGTIPQAAIPPTPYNEIVARIRVTTVIPSENRFLVGTRSFVRGDRFPLAYNTRNYPSQVIEVTRKRIVFRNLETSETGELPLDMMPEGMSKGGRSGIIPGGMQPPKSDAPLEIESSEPPDTPNANPPPGGLTN